MAAKYQLNCHDNRGGNCFANRDGGCGALDSYTKALPNGKFQKMTGTKFPDGRCPFYKTAEEAGGDYEALCAKYPL